MPYLVSGSSLAFLYVNQLLTIIFSGIPCDSLRLVLLLKLPVILQRTNNETVV